MANIDKRISTAEIPVVQQELEHYLHIPFELSESMEGRYLVPVNGGRKFNLDNGQWEDCVPCETGSNITVDWTSSRFNPEIQGGLEL